MAVGLPIVQRNMLGANPQEGGLVIGEQVRLGNRTYQLMNNPDAGASVVNQGVNFAADKMGPLRILQFMGKGGAAAQEALRLADYEVPKGLTGVTQFANRAWPALALPAVPKVTSDAFKAIQEAQKDAVLPGQAQRRMVDAVQKSCTALAMIGYSTSMLAACAKNGAELSAQAKIAADVFDAGDSTLGLAKSIQDWSKARREADLAAANNMHPLVQTAFLETGRLNLIRAIKATCSIAGFVFGIAALIGSAVVSPIVALTVSLASTVLAIWATLYENSMDKKPVDFFKERSVEVLVAQVG